MKITLERISNNYAWLWGLISINNKIYCDSLEMGNENQIKEGIYDIRICYNKDHSEQFIAIFSKANQFISVFVKNNNYIYYEIEMRRDNNFITIGQKQTICYLKRQEPTYYTLMEMIEKAYENNEIVELEVKNTLKIT